MLQQTRNDLTEREETKNKEQVSQIDLPRKTATIANRNYPIIERLSKAKPNDIQGIVASQIQLLDNYYDLVLEQARKSFKWALIAAGVGFLFFVASVILLLIYRIQNISTISLIGGTLMEIISGINFHLYGRASKQLAHFHTRLDLTQRYLLANSLCENLEKNLKQKALYNLIKKIAAFDSEESENNIEMVNEENTKE